MKYKIVTTKSYEKDLKRMKKRGKNLQKLRDVVFTLAQGEQLPQKFRTHKLSGDWANCWECHVEPDWLLVWQYYEDELTLVSTGTHSDLF